MAPQPLWTVTADAELIVLAEVQGVEPLEKDENNWHSAIARLKVLETLKGPELPTVKVLFPANLTWTAPPRYAEGETVFAFLVKEQASWRTVSLSYGTVYPSGDELEDVRTMILAAVESQSPPLDGQQIQLRRREWLVQAAALPATRWHGLYQLVPNPGDISPFYSGSGGFGSPPLSRDHQALLAEALVSAPKMDSTFSMMLRLLGQYEDPRLDLLALETLEGLLALEKPPWWSRDLLWVVLARFGDGEPKDRLLAYDAKPGDLTPEQQREIWSSAKIELDIPDAAAAEIELESHGPASGHPPS